MRDSSKNFNPPLNEIFFAKFSVLVEGTEDIAFLRTQFDLRDKWTKFLSLGGHIVPVLGKEAMVSPVAICTTLDHPFFCVLDADGEKFGNDAHTKALASMTSTDLSELEQGKDYFGERAVVWHSKIGVTVANDLNGDWGHALSAVCRGIGANEGKASKNPLIINLTLNTLASAGKFSKSLDRAIETILSFGASIR